MSDDPRLWHAAVMASARWVCETHATDEHPAIRKLREALRGLDECIERRENAPKVEPQPGFSVLFPSDSDHGRDS